VRAWEASQGRPVGPAGYRRNGDRFVPDDKAPAVRLAGELYASGTYGVGAITTALHNAGHTWCCKTQVDEWFRNVVYAGYIQLDDQVHPGNHEALWNEELWERIQQVRQQRARRYTKPLTKNPPLLSGVIRCSCSGSSMWYHKKTNDVYKCTAHRPYYKRPPVNIECSGDFAYAVEVEGTVKAFLAGLALTPDLVERVVSLHQDAKAALRLLKQRFLDDELSAEEYARAKQELETSAPVAAPIPLHAGPDAAMLRQLLGDLPSLLAEADRRVLRPVLMQLVNEVYARRRVVVALRPTLLGAQLIAAADRAVLNERACWWAGRGSNPRPWA
jgi:hypothetical protein